jgi:hypothetical protein
VSISNYIGNTGDGTNWKERLTSSLKSFTVPVNAPGFQINGRYGATGQCLKSTGTGTIWGPCKTEQAASGRGSTVLKIEPIASGQCAAPVTATVPGANGSSVVHWSFGSDPYGIAGFIGSASGAGLQIYAFTTENTVAFRVCNNSSQSITPSSIAINWDVF